MTSHLKNLCRGIQNITEVSRTDRKLASDQLWNILSPHIQYLPVPDAEMVRLAFWQMVEAHGEQRRKSGEYYITHPVSACLTLADIRLDSHTLAACLMHDVPEDTNVSLETIQKNFSAEVAFLIFGITKLSKLKYKGDGRYSENLRRMFVAMSQDIRVIFIKLADRLHNLHTLSALPPDKARRIAMESIEIYAPIAERLGIGKMKGEIEDTAFPYLFPQEYQKFISRSELAIHERQQKVRELIEMVQEIFKKENMPCLSIHGRAKHYYSLFRKLEGELEQLGGIHDLVALRIVTDSIDNCYQMLSILHARFEPVENRIKDYIVKPKPNGYQSLHTTVRDVAGGTTFEIQIRTQEMHDFAEFGVASHWAYKENKDTTHFRLARPESLKWIKELVDLGEQKLSEEEYLRMVKLDLFKDRIFVMTPKGDVIDLPQGATALDFAYKIHREIGYHAMLAKTNGNAVKLSDPLQSGDTVEILTDKKQKPKPDWLHWAKTSAAQSRIRNDLRRLGYQV